jgi:uncharacterized protein
MLKVLIVGGTGLIGQYISEQLSSQYDIHILSRKKRDNNGVIKYLQWNPEIDMIDPLALDCEIIINLSGEGITTERWTDERKKLLIDSRVKPLAFLENKLAAAQKSPQLFIGASAIGYYGDQGTKSLDENSPSGQGFLSECSLAWEKASVEVGALAQRFVIMRIGIVLSTKGGALPELMMTSKLGVLSYFGDMIYSWIHIHDIYGIIAKSIEDNRYQGIINAVSPHPIENKKMVETIADSLGGRLVIPAPQFAIKLALGERSDVVLYSTSVQPTRLKNLGYSFHFPDLRPALDNLLSNKI